MTCIATDGKTMAADGLACVGHLITTESRVKLVRCPDGSVVGVAGDATGGALMREWFSKGEDRACLPVIKPGDEAGTPVEALILRPDGRVEFMDWNFTAVEHDRPAAIGSGREIAIGLMLAGVTPGEAVAGAARRVASVGGKVIEWKPGKDERGSD